MSEYRKDEYKKVQIPFGYNEKSEKVMLSLFHSFFVAMTGHGKTLGMKSLLFRFHELHPDWKILIIDSKDKRDYADLNADIPICFVETTDPLDLKNLLEPIVGAKLMYYFDKIIEEAVFDTLGEIQRSIHQKVVDADEHRIRIHSKELGKLRVLDYTMGKLVALVEKPNIINELKLHDGFNVMPIALPEVKNPNLKRAFQQLITRSVLILLLSDPSLEKTLLVLDEVHKWSPQKWASICKQPLSEFVSEGRSQDKMLWESDQALTKVDKEPLKNIKIWIVGQQMEANEVDDAKNTVNDLTDLSVTESDIKTLKIGNFILVDGLHGKVEKVYLQPFGVPDDVAVKIAQGADSALAEPFIRAVELRLRKKLKEGDDEMVWKEKAERLEEELKQIKDLLKEKELLSKQEAKKELDELQRLHNEEIERVRSEADLNGYSRGRADAETELDAKLQELHEEHELIEHLRSVLNVPAAPSVKQGQDQKISLESSLTEISVEDKSPKELSMTTDTPSGKIMYCTLQLHNAILKKDSLATPIFTSADLQKEAAEHGWQVPNRSLGGTLMVMVREGQLIQEGKGSYRLPSKIKINVKPSMETQG